MSDAYIRVVLSTMLIYSACCSPVFFEHRESRALTIREGGVSSRSTLGQDEPEDWSTETSDRENAVAIPHRLKLAARGLSGSSLPLAFSAYLSHNVDDLIAGGTVKFDRYLLNEGGHYDTATGIFTVPISGVYFFSYFVGCRGEHQVFVMLTLNGIQMSEAEAQTNSKYDDSQGGNVSIFYASAGQHVEVRYKEGDGHIESNENERYSTFSGHFLYVQ